MTYALLAFSGLSLTGVITLALLMHSAQKGQQQATDRAAAETVQRVQAQDELRLANLTVKAKDGEIDILKQRLTEAERQRNKAFADAKEHVLKELQSAKLADAASFVAGILAEPIHGGVLPKGRLSDDPVDGLLDPNA